MFRVRHAQERSKNVTWDTGRPPSARGVVRTKLAPLERDAQPHASRLERPPSSTCDLAPPPARSVTAMERSSSMHSPMRSSTPARNLRHSPMLQKNLCVTKLVFLGAWQCVVLADPC